MRIWRSPLWRVCLQVVFMMKTTTVSLTRIWSAFHRRVCVFRIMHEDRSVRQNTQRQNSFSDKPELVMDIEMNSAEWSCLKGFILGISSRRESVLLYCIPVSLSFFNGRGRRRRKKNFFYLGEFMAGRLAGYILFAILAWATGRIILTPRGSFARWSSASAYILLSIWSTFPSYNISPY